MNAISQKHDHFFFSAMGNPKLALSFFKTHVPAKILSKCDLSTLKMFDTKLIRSDLKKRELDVIYKMQLRDGKEAYFYVLCEHQSNYDKTMILRLREYMYLLINKHMELNNTSKPPIIFPMVLYAGSTRWHGPRNFFKLYDEHEELAKEIAMSPFHLIDVQSMDDDDFKKQELAGLMSFLMKYKKVKDMHDYFQKLKPMLKIVEIDESSNLSKVVLTYLYDNLETEQAQEFTKMAQEQLSGEVRQKAMTLGEGIRLMGVEEGRQEGRQEGLQKGLQKGRIKALHEVAHNLLRLGRGIDEVVAVTNLSRNEVMDIQLELSK